MYKNVSYWEENSFLNNIDLAIVGSGIVGLSAALAYKERFPERKVVLLERGSLPTGASTKNAGFACFGSITELIADYKEYGEDQVVQLLQQRWEGLNKLRNRVGEVGMDYEEYGGFELLLEQEDYKEIEAYIPFFNDRIAQIIGVRETFSKIDAWRQFGFGQQGIIIKNKAEGQIHPGKMMMRLVELAQRKGIFIFNGCSVQSVEDQTDCVSVQCNSYEIQARQVLFATNGFTKRLFPFLAIQPARNQVLLTAPIPDLAIKGCFHFEEGYYYFRNIGNRLLLGGARNMDKTGEATDHFGETAIIQESLRKFLDEIVLPNQSVAIEQSWSGIMGVGPTKAPIIEKLSNRVGVAVRLGGMGVAIGSLVGTEGANLFD